MKIVQVTSSFPPNVGGLEQHVRRLSEGLRDRGYDVTVFSADRGSVKTDEQPWQAIDLRRFRSLSPGGHFHVAPSITRAVRGIKADVVHAHNYHSLPLFFAALGITDERFVVTPHYHGGSASHWRNLLLRACRPLGRGVLANADTVVAVSEWEREQLEADFGIESEVIPNGVDVSRFEGTAPEQPRRPYLLYVGRLESYKGVQYTIEALTRPELTEYDLVVAGTGPYREALERLANELGIASRVSFPGFVPEDELPDLYAGADVFVSLSSFEAYGMTVGEALAAGTSCVVRTAGALGDWAERPDCIGVNDVTAERIASAVQSARDRVVDTDSIPSWEEALDRLEIIYGD